MSNYLEYLKQIDELTKKAEAARKEERGAAIADVKAKIKAFGLTAEDLGLSPRAARGRDSATPNGRSPRQERAARPDSRSGPRKGKPSPLKGLKRKVKYRGPAGQPWSGVGRKPVWVTEALAAGRTLDEFAVRD